MSDQRVEVSLVSLAACMDCIAGLLRWPGTDHAVLLEYALHRLNTKEWDDVPAQRDDLRLSVAEALARVRGVSAENVPGNPLAGFDAELRKLLGDDQ